MTATIKSGTLTIAYTATTEKLTTVLDAAAHYLYPHYPLTDEKGEAILWEALTDKQKLGVIDAHIKRVIMDAAKTYKAQAAIDAARIEAEKEDMTL